MRPNSIIIFMVYILTIFTGVNAIYDRYGIHRPMHHYSNPFEIIQTPKMDYDRHGIHRPIHDCRFPFEKIQTPKMEFHINRCPSSCLFGRGGRGFTHQHCAIMCRFNYNIPY